MVDSISKLDEKLAGIKRRIAELEAAQTETQDPRQASLRQDIEKHEVLLTKLTRELPNREATAKKKEEERDHIVQEIGDLEQQRDAQEAEASRAKNTIRNLETQVSNRLSAFGTNIEAVLQEIDAARWRHSKPLGPLGRYVHLNDFQYKDVVSSHLGLLLCGFAVRCKEDRVQMMSILHRCSKQK
jgi:chromosome segregation ATPase